MLQNGDQARQNEVPETERLRPQQETQVQQERIQETAAENARLRQENQALKAERDQYLTALYASLKKQVPPDEAAWAVAWVEAKQSGRDFADLVHAAEASVPLSRIA